jgi:hypothetical protein
MLGFLFCLVSAEDGTSTDGPACRAEGYRHSQTSDELLDYSTDENEVGDDEDTNVKCSRNNEFGE